MSDPAEPLSAEEIATLRLEAEAEQHHPGQHGEWERLTLRLLATLDAALAGDEYAQATDAAMNYGEGYAAGKAAALAPDPEP